MREWQRYDSRAYHLCNLLLQSLDQKLKSQTQATSDRTVVQKTVAERPIGIMLVIMQRLRSLEPPPASQTFLRDGHSRRQRLWAIMDITHLWDELISFASGLQGAAQATLMARRLCPFLQRFHLVANGLLSSLTTWAKSLFKLASVLLTLAQNLAENGFCKPEENSGQSVEQGTEMKADGTGVGDGQGDKDVSKDIEDESQVEGLQGQDGDPEKDRDNKREDKGESGMDVENDFEGELEDVQENDEGSGTDSEEEHEFEEKIEGLDPADPDVVDEKMWRDQNEPEGSKEVMQSQKQSKEGSDESQIAAKEDDQRRQDASGPHKRDLSSPQDNHETPDSEGDIPDTENLPNEAGAQIDDHVQEEENLDIPEGLDLELEAEAGLSDVEEGEDGSDFDRRDKERGEEVDTDRFRSESEPSIDGRMETSASDDLLDEVEKGDLPEITAKRDESLGGGQQDSKGNSNNPIDCGDAEDNGGQQMDVENQAPHLTEPLQYVDRNTSV